MQRGNVVFAGGVHEVDGAEHATRCFNLAGIDVVDNGLEDSWIGVCSNEGRLKIYAYSTCW